MQLYVNGVAYHNLWPRGVKWWGYVNVIRNVNYSRYRAGQINVLTLGPTPTFSYQQWFYRMLYDILLDDKRPKTWRFCWTSFGDVENCGLHSLSCLINGNLGTPAVYLCCHLITTNFHITEQIYKGVTSKHLMNSLVSSSCIRCFTSTCMCRGHPFRFLKKQFY